MARYAIYVRDKDNFLKHSNIPQGHCDEEYCVIAECIDGFYGIRAYFTVEHKCRTYFCEAHGDDGSWWLVSTCSAWWMQDILQGLREFMSGSARYGCPECGRNYTTIDLAAGCHPKAYAAACWYRTGMKIQKPTPAEDNTELYQVFLITSHDESYHWKPISIFTSEYAAEEACTTEDHYYTMIIPNKKLPKYDQKFKLVQGVTHKIIITPGKGWAYEDHVKWNPFAIRERRSE